MKKGKPRLTEAMVLISAEKKKKAMVFAACL